MRISLTNREAAIILRLLRHEVKYGGCEVCKQDADRAAKRIAAAIAATRPTQDEGESA